VAARYLAQQYLFDPTAIQDVGWNRRFADNMLMVINAWLPERMNFPETVLLNEYI
jgi:hypothetical protein